MTTKTFDASAQSVVIVKNLNRCKEDKKIDELVTSK